MRIDQETGTELDGAAAAAAIVQSWKDQPRLKVTLCDIDVRREGRWIVLEAKFRQHPAVTLRVSRAWAETLRLRLASILGK